MKSARAEEWGFAWFAPSHYSVFVGKLPFWRRNGVDALPVNYPALIICVGVEGVATPYWPGGAVLGL